MCRRILATLVAVSLVLASSVSAAFVRFEGPFYPSGPIWRVDAVGPRWK